MFALKMYLMILRSYIELLKMRLSSSVVFSAIAGYLLAISEKTPHDPIVLSKLIVGGTIPLLIAIIQKMDSIAPAAPRV